MPDPNAWLGGRLPLLDPARLSQTRKKLWDRTDATMGRWAAKIGFASKTSDGRFIGPFNPMLRSPDLALAFLQFQHDEAEHTSLSERIRQVVIYAHSAAAHAAGFSDTCVSALVAGAPCAELAAEERLAQRVTLALTAGQAVDDDLYADALRLLGEKGLVDLVVLAGCYQLVCSLLILFAVPAPATDFDHSAAEV